MASLFNKEPADQPELTPLDRIGPEIEHLKKKTSTRKGAHVKTTLPVLTFLVLIAVACLYFLDPPLYAYHRGEAIRTYLYLHNFGSSAEAANLLATHIFTDNEVGELNQQKGPYQDYFPSTEAANRKADNLIAYYNGVHLLRDGKYDDLDAIGKIRYVLFVRQGIIPPIEFSSLNPSVEP